MSSRVRYVSNAPTLWRLLNGVLCIYKPAGRTVNDVRHAIATNIAADLNQMECRPPVEHIFIEGDANKVKVRVRESYADNTLVVGPRYLPTDIRCTWATSMSKNTSGVLVLGINRGTKKALKMHSSRPVRVYHVGGKLGIASDTYNTRGKVVERATFKHVKVGIMEKVIAGVQAAHQRQMFERAGVDVQSQAAYELAVQGPIRPADGKIPLLYSIKCVNFEPPDFTLEVKCINEYEDYFEALIHEIGLELRSVAACTGVRCIRYGHFTLEHTLLRKHWRLQHIFTNLSLCEKIFSKEKNSIYETPAALMQKQCGGVCERPLVEQS